MCDTFSLFPLKLLTGTDEILKSVNFQIVFQLILVLASL